MSFDYELLQKSMFSVTSRHMIIECIPDARFFPEFGDQNVGKLVFILNLLLDFSCEIKKKIPSLRKIYSDTFDYV